MSSRNSRLVLLSLALAALAACQTGNSQSGPATGGASTPAAIPPVNYTLKPGPLGDGIYTLVASRGISTCFFYVSNQNRMFALNDPILGHVQGSASHVNLVIEQTPGAQTCPKEHPQSRLPMATLRRPIEYNPGSLNYRVELTTGEVCLIQQVPGSRNQATCTRPSEQVTSQPGT